MEQQYGKCDTEACITLEGDKLFSQSECSFWSGDQNKQHGNLPLPSCRVADFDTLVFPNKSIHSHDRMLKDLIKAIPTSRGMNLGRDQP